MDSPLSTKAILLQVLAAGPGYGSELMGRAQERFEMKLSAGSVYPCLSDLEDDGCIRRRRVTTVTRACYFELTKRGQDLAEEQRKVVAKVYGFCDDEKVK